MKNKPRLLLINGSASHNSSNERLVGHLKAQLQPHFDCEIFDRLKELPHFDPEQTLNTTPETVMTIRNSIAAADVIVICSPEYIFSIPSGLKNLLEWCVATTVFSEKVCGLIIASAHGAKAYEELQLLLRTLSAKFTADTCLLIQGIKGKIAEDGKINDPNTELALDHLVKALRDLAIS